MSHEVKRWWKIYSKEFQDTAHVPIAISYGPGMPLEKKLQLLPKQLKGKKVLEIGCGGAQCGIAFAKKGAIVTGVDISKEQLEHAKKLIKKHNVSMTLLQRDIKNLQPIKSQSQDIVFSTWALFYVSDLQKCFNEVYRVLKKGGIFVFSTMHPFWDVTDSKDLVARHSYFDTGKMKTMHSKAEFVWFHVTVSQLINYLINAGFTIERVEEPDPRKKDHHTSKEIVSEAYKRKAMKIVPRSIIIRAKK